MSTDKNPPEWGIEPPPSGPGFSRLTVIAVVLFLLGLFAIAWGVGSFLSTDDSDTPGPLPTVTFNSPGPTPPAVLRKFDAPLTVTGEHADDILITAFAATQQNGYLTVQLRIQNVIEDPLRLTTLRATALDGEDIAAVANGFLPTIAPGQTVTAELWGGDGRFVDRKRYAYTLEVN